MSLQGQTVAVTGGGAGIGEAVALECAQRGAHVAILDIDSGKVESVASRVRELGARAMGVSVDVADYSAVQREFGQIADDFGGIDVLVNNAGIADYRLFAELNEQAWDRMISVNLKGAFNCTNAVIRGMMDRSYGRIVNVASVAGVTGTPRHSHYSAAKGGMIGLTKALAKEVGPSGITVNVVAPGLVETAITQGPGFPSELTEYVLERTPVKRIGSVEDIAYAVAFLASDRAGFVTGQVLSPNGGYVI